MYLNAQTFMNHNKHVAIIAVVTDFILFFWNGNLYWRKLYSIHELYREAARKNPQKTATTQKEWELYKEAKASKQKRKEKSKINQQLLPSS